ncbi:hypothetical protein HDU91_004151, partial [Kappamyces sp. JEL0680]
VLQQGLYFMSGISGALNRPPVLDNVTYLMRSYRTGNTYTVSLPWIVSQKDDKLKTTLDLYYKLVDRANNASVAKRDWGLEQLSPIPIPLPHRSEAKTGRVSWRAVDRPERARIFGQKQNAAPIQFQPTPYSYLTWAIYNNTGILRLSSFSGTSLQDFQTFPLFVQKLLRNELKDTKSIVIDVRGNTGGYPVLAESIPQLFAKSLSTAVANSQVSNAVGRQLVTPITRQLYLELGYSTIDTVAAFRDAPAGSRYSLNASMNPIANSNQLGVSYARPVAVLTDGLCFSSCDLFVELMQDNGIATIFGEDGQTGGGGAAVLDYHYSLANQDPSVFAPLPYATFFGV